jgi:hypothetical protein
MFIKKENISKINNSEIILNRSLLFIRSNKFKKLHIRERTKTEFIFKNIYITKKFLELDIINIKKIKYKDYKLTKKLVNNDKMLYKSFFKLLIKRPVSSISALNFAMSDEFNKFPGQQNMTVILFPIELFSNEYSNMESLAVFNKLDYDSRVNNLKDV